MAPACLQPLILPWTVSAVLSLSYFYFYFKSEGCVYAPSGFCITNYAPDLDSGICPSKTDNSHFWCGSAYSKSARRGDGVVFVLCHHSSQSMYTQGV